VTAGYVSDSVELEPLVEELNLPEGALVLGTRAMPVVGTRRCRRLGG